MRGFFGVCVLGVVLLAACGRSAPQADYAGSAAPAMSYDMGGVPAPQALNGRGPESPAAGEASPADAASVAPLGVPAAATASGAADANAAQRKLVCTAQVEIAVVEFDALAAKVAALATAHGGFISKAQMSGAAGGRRFAEWTLRLPVAQFDACFQAAQGLGEVRSASLNTQDVTNEYYDVEARIRNGQAEEQRLIALLEDRTARLQDVLDVEREIARVREAIELQQGRLRVLSDLTDLSTLTLRANELTEYVPPAQPVFTERVARAWADSLHELRGASEDLAIRLVSFAPWSPLVIVPALLLWFLGRKFVRKLLTRAVVASPAGPPQS